MVDGQRVTLLEQVQQGRRLLSISTQQPATAPAIVL